MPSRKALESCVGSLMLKRPKAQVRRALMNGQIPQTLSPCVYCCLKRRIVSTTLKDYVTVDELDLEIHFVKENVLIYLQLRTQLGKDKKATLKGTREVVINYPIGTVSAGHWNFL
jgi:hypothetical protein